MNEKVIIFKNEKTGDLIHAYNAIQKLIKRHFNKEIFIFLSHYNSEMRFLFKEKNIKFKIITEKISIIDKIRIILFFLNKKIKEVYIFKPSNFLFWLPVFFYFKKIKFFGICVDNNNYKRPIIFLRKFLNKHVINDRGTQKIRKSIHDLHMSLLDNNNNTQYSFGTINLDHNFENELKDYILIHFNKFKFNKLNLGLTELYNLIEILKSAGKKIVLTNDLNDNDTNNLLSIKYKKNNKSSVFYYPNVKGADLFKLIGNASIVISFHGMITSIAASQNTRVIDLFNCEINSKNDFYRYKNAFHEFVPKQKNYEFLIPKKNFNNKIKRIENLFKNGRKINY